MESNSGLNILAVAQQEYMGQLNDVMLPFLITNFDQMYDDSVKESKGKNTLKVFQQHLRDVKNWNQGMVQDATKEIVDSCGHFDKLLAAVFVGYVKILSSVRLRDEKRKIPIRLPKNGDFVFKVYEECARAIYKDPYWFAEDLSEDDKLDKMTSINSVVLERVVKNMVPINKILETYMSAAPSGDNNEIESVAGGDLSDTEDPEILNAGEDTEIPVAEPEEEATPEEPEIPEPEAADEPEVPEPEEEVSPDEDVKQVPLVGVNAPQEDEDDDLMPGAPDSRK